MGRIQQRAVYSSGSLTKNTPDSAVSLQLASGYPNGTEALGISGNEQVGYGGLAPVNNAQINHALLWHGSANSVVDLNPSGYVQSEATATNGSQEIGYAIDQQVLPDGFVDNLQHAIEWDGSANSYLDLNQFLPSGTTSDALGIDANRDILDSQATRAENMPLSGCPYLSRDRRGCLSLPRH